MPPLTEANHAARARNVTASEVGALLGKHPYATPQTIYDRLMGLEAPREPSAAMEIGSAMEGAILRYAQARHGFKARQNSRTYEHSRVRLSATPDAFTSRLPWDIMPVRAIVEVKMSARLDQWRDLPEQYEWQVRAQLACTNRDHGAVFALVGMSLNTYAVYRDRQMEERLLQAVERFWTDHIVTGIRPPDPTPTPKQEISFP